MKSHARVIVSGDKDLLSLHEWNGIRITTPRQYLYGNQLSKGAD